MIEARGLTKRYGDKLAVDHLTFTIGVVTGFLGPNGAGKFRPPTSSERFAMWRRVTLWSLRG